MKTTLLKLLPLALALGFAVPNGFAQGQSGGGVGGVGGGPPDIGPHGGPGGGPGGGGGNYGGPGDTVPPGGGNGGGGGPVDGPPVPPGGGGSAGGGYAPGADPLRPAPFLPGGPGDPSGGAPTRPRTPGSRPLTESPTSWQLWWHYNRWDHLRPSSPAARATTGSTGFFLGRGQTPQISPTRHPGSSELRDQVHPALVRVLRENSSVDLTDHALLAFAKLREVDAKDADSSFGRVIGQLLRDGNPFIVEHAILALGIRGDDSAFANLSAIALDDDAGREVLGRSRLTERQRFFAAIALGLLGERTRNDGLRARIDNVLGSLIVDRSQGAPQLKAAALLALGHVPLPTDDQLAVAEGLPKGARARVDQVLSVLAYFEHEDSDVIARSQAPRAAARLVRDAPESLRQRVLASFLTVIGQHSREPREILGATVQALGLIATSGSDPMDTAIRNELERLAYGSSSDKLVRSFAIVALARASARPGPGEEPMAGYASTMRLFQKRLGRSRGQTLAWTTLGLGLLEEDAAARGEAADPDVTANLRFLLEKSRNDEVAGAAAVALGLVRDTEAQDILVEKLNESGNERVRAYAALALGMIGEPSVVQELRQHVERSAQQPFALEQGAIALALLGDQDAGPALLRILEKANPTVQSSIASAMGWIRDPRGLKILARRLNDPTRSSVSRGWAAVAIGRIADRDDWPWVARLSTDVQYDLDLTALVDPIFERGLLDLR